MRRLTLLALLFLPSIIPATGAFAQNGTTALSFSHVIIVVEENHSYSDVVGNTRAMPFINKLISRYGSATRYFANAHPSLPNYLVLTTGGTAGITSDICGVTVTDDNIVRKLTAAGISWKAYEEDLPYTGYLGCSSGKYTQNHNPFAYFSDVQNSPELQRNIVPFTEFAADLRKGTLPRLSFIAPNLRDDAHNGTLSQADRWLRTQIRPLLAKPMFRHGGSALLIITFDEGNKKDNENGGGRIPWVAIGPTVKRRYRSSTFYQHQSTLRLILKGLGISNLPGAAATAPDMIEFFRSADSGPDVAGVEAGCGSTHHLTIEAPNEAAISRIGPCHHARVAR